eukprot:SAG31_NODE_2689_length_5243_cov_3.364697_3_plen_105_part_00
MLLPRILPWLQVNLSYVPAPDDAFVHGASQGTGSGFRRLFGYAGQDACSFSNWDDRLAELTYACCGENDDDDQCVDGVPQACDLECGGTLHVALECCVNSSVDQ